MSFIGDLFAGGTKGVLEGVGSLAVDLRTAITGKTPLDPAKQAELEMNLAALEAAALQSAATFDTEQMKGQNAVNLAEAQGSDKFASRWRPAVGWVCVLGLAYTFLLKPLLPWTIAVGALIVGRVSVVPPLPEVPMGDLLILLGGMLGLGTMRTFERVKGVGK